ncbi:MAG: hypothetical protein FJX23_06065 [Alphaproteobacteria bacterium]|nr:hypothetical protein [Alphaproteobacteria bacterium]
MAFLRFITVLLTCLFFATASVAGGMLCCKSDYTPHEMAPEAQKKAMPCHEKAADHSSQHDGKDSAKIAQKGCQCACSLQSMSLPQFDFKDIALPVSKSDAELTRLALDLSPPIETPPKITS